MKTTTRVQFFLPLLTFAFACGGPDTGVSEADLVATLQLGMVFFTGPLAEIGQLIEQLLDKTGRGELSKAFMTVTGMTG